jgi:Histidine kinase
MAVLAGLAAVIAWSAYQPLQTRLIKAFGPSINIFEPVVWRTAQGEEFNAVFTTQPSALLRYNLWLSLFYGGLLVAGYALSMRGERTRAALGEAALARGRTEALLGELQLQTLQAQIDPALLLAALAEVQRLYPQQSDRADALLERLVDFLRAAMPALKQRDSTLRAELQLAEALARLQALMPGGARWQVEWPPSLPERAFPSLLLPVMALVGESEAPRRVVQVGDAQLSLRVQGLGRGLPPNLEQRCRASLQAMLGPRFRLRVNESPQTQLLIELDPSPTAKELEHEPGLS